MTFGARTTLVTCIYNGLSGTPFGGRRNRDADYRASLTTIAGCGRPIVCFVAPEALEDHARYYRTAAPNVVLRPLALTDVPGSAAVQHIKRTRPQDFESIEWRERCVEIMWGKFHMLHQVLAADPAVASVFWIDAGLANVNVISTKYTTADALGAWRLSEVSRAFPSVLIDRLVDAAGDRVLALKCTQPHNRGLPARYNRRPYEDGDGLIGGLFGGSRAAVAELCRHFDAKVRATLAEGEIYFEESLLTGIRADHPELFHCHTFDSWYHEGWAAHDPALRPFSGFFDHLLQTPPSLPAPRFPWQAAVDAAEADPAPAPLAPPVPDPGPEDDLFDGALHRLGLADTDVRFVQIGAMDGVSFDELHGYARLHGWAGLLVEPMPWLFERLTAAYAGLDPDGVRYRFERAAIADHDGTIPMIAIDPRAVDTGQVAPCFGGMSAIWPPRNGLASAADAAVVSSWGRLVDVPCLTLASLFARHDIRRMDVFCIDAEGWDVRILRQLDVDHLRPVLIRCEWVNLDDAERQEALDWLRTRGYVVRVAGQNLDAVDGAVWRAMASGAPIAGARAPISEDRLTLVTAVAPRADAPGAIGDAVSRVVRPLAATGHPVVAFADACVIDACRRETSTAAVAWVARDFAAMAGELTRRQPLPSSGRSRADLAADLAARLAPLLLHDAAVINPFSTGRCLWVPAAATSQGRGGPLADLAAWEALLDADLRYHVIRIAEPRAGRDVAATHALGGTIRAIRALNPRLCERLTAEFAAAATPDVGRVVEAVAAACPWIVAGPIRSGSSALPS